MNSITVINIFRFVAPLAGLMLLLITLPRLLGPAALPRGFHLPGLLLELVETEDEVEAVKRVTPPDTIRQALKFDNFVFIPLYTLIFLVLGYWLAGRAQPFALALGIMVCVGVVVMAGFDVLENARTYEVLKASSPQVVDAIRHAALVKWSILFALALVLSLPFLRSGGWLFLVGLLYLVTAAVGLLGVVWFRPLVQWGFMLTGLSLLVTGEAVRHVPTRM